MTTTFSQFVDSMIAKLGRPDQTLDAAGWGNSTIRELHANQQGRPIFYQKNMKEEVLISNLEDNFFWVPPDNTQIVRTVRYVSVTDVDGEPVYPKGINPGRAQRGQEFFYYRNQDAVFFKGYGGDLAIINVAYYIYLASLVYFAVGSRPATFDQTTMMWTYNDLTSSGGINYDLDETTRELAETLSTNWMLNDWEETISVGTRQKGYADVGEETRSRSLFARYSNQRVQLSEAEGDSTLLV